MTRALRLATALLLLTTPATIAQSPSPGGDWRPAPPDRLAALDAELQPYLVDFEAVFNATINELTAVTSYIPVAPPDALRADLTRRIAGIARLDADLDEMAVDAVGILAALDRSVIVPCLQDYAAVLRSGALILGDSIASVRADDAANEHLGVALYLLIPYGTLVHNQAAVECAA